MWSNDTNMKEREGEEESEAIGHLEEVQVFTDTREYFPCVLPQHWVFMM